MRQISLITPTRNNLEYLKWNYARIRELYPEVEMCVADDFSSDGTWDWLQETAATDTNLKIMRNNGPERLGHTILYDFLINNYATKPVIGIWHADMYAAEGMLEAVMKNIESDNIISITRIEPPLHPAGPEKVLLDVGLEPDEFDGKVFDGYVKQFKSMYKDQTSNGIFAPWFIYKFKFQEIGGHDDLFAPQSKEDSDIFNRFVLAGMKPIQLKDEFCYHLTCRGSRYNPYLTRIGNESPEWLKQNEKSHRNFIRKWGSPVLHTETLEPIIRPKRQITLVFTGNVDKDLLYFVEPFATCVEIEDSKLVSEYISEEQPSTKFDLSSRVFVKNSVPRSETDNVFYIDTKVLNPEQIKRFVFDLQVTIQKLFSQDSKFGKRVVTDGFVADLNSDKNYVELNIINTNTGVKPYMSLI